MHRAWPSRGNVIGFAVGAALLAAAAPAHAEIPYAKGVTPGELRGIALTEDSPWPASYWEYIPSDFDPDGDTLYPMLMTLGGIGTMDTVSVCPDLAQTCTVAQCEAEPAIDGLCRVYRRGPAVEIRQGVWDDMERPFIVIQPQNREPTFSAEDYDRDELDALVQFVVDNYPVDPRRLYILGNSQGGRATYQYLALYARRMAAASAGPGGVIAEADFGCRLQDTALWAFHGENDVDSNVAPGAFDPCFVARNISRANEPGLYDDVYETCADRMDIPFPEARMTMFQNTAHNAWTPGYENVTQGFATAAWTADEMCGFETNWVQYDPLEYADGVYTWLLEHDRPGVDAGDPLVVPGDVDTATITPVIVDDDAWTASWEQLSGPAITMTPGMDGTLELSEFDYDATYTFRLFVVDADNQWDEDTVEVTIEPEVSEGGSSSSSGGDTSTSTGGDDSTSSGGSSGSSGGSGTTGGSSGGGEASTTAGGATTSGSASASGSDDGPGGSDASPSTASDSNGDTSESGDDTDTDASGPSGSAGGCTTGGTPSFGYFALLAFGLVRRRR
ncbi:MAG: PKD domain-containing protein [Nannocystaceae bacterium]|nr:hypothetical protein [bacterium]